MARKRRQVPLEPVRFVGAKAAIECRCPDKECTGWRASTSNGGGHITFDRAMDLLREQRGAQQ